MSLNNSSTENAGVGLLDLLDRRLLDDGDSLYSLIDGAKFSQLNRILSTASKSIEFHSLLGEAATADAVYAGPILIWHKAREQCLLLRKFLNERDSAEFLSLIVSGEYFTDMIKKLTWLTEVRHEDGTEWVMRFYDPLILPHWLAVLDAEQRVKALSGMHQWIFCDMRGFNQSVDMVSDLLKANVVSNAMTITNRQCDELMKACMPYIVMSQLLDDNIQALDTVPANQRYDFFKLQIKTAHSLRITSPIDVKTFCLLALMFGSELGNHPFIIRAASNINLSLSFSEQVMQWPEEHWEFLEADMLPSS